MTHVWNKVTRNKSYVNITVNMSHLHLQQNQRCSCYHYEKLFMSSDITHAIVGIFSYAWVDVACTKGISATCPYTWWQHPQFSSSSLSAMEDLGKVSQQVADPSFSASFHHHLCPLFPVLPKMKTDQGGPDRDPSSSCGLSSCDVPLLPPLLEYLPLSPVQERNRRIMQG